jgi:3-oxoacyl-[acyl-carrier protein] reductase
VTDTVPAVPRMTALVTGASRGIGQAIAVRLAAEGYDLTISARTADGLGETVQAVQNHGRRVLAQPADMADEEQVAALAEAHIQQFGQLNVLVLAAGVGIAGELADYPLRRLDTQLAVNLKGPLLLVQRLLPALRGTAASFPDAAARIIAVASITGVVSEPGLAAYGATKAALISLCESISVAESRNGVTATAISPGYVDTDMASWVRDQVNPAGMINRADVAELAMALCRLSRNAVVPHIVVTRPGRHLWRA